MKPTGKRDLIVVQAPRVAQVHVHAAQRALGAVLQHDAQLVRTVGPAPADEAHDVRVPQRGHQGELSDERLHHLVRHLGRTHRLDGAVVPAVRAVVDRAEAAFAELHAQREFSVVKLVNTAIVQKRR